MISVFNDFKIGDRVTMSKNTPRRSIAGENGTIKAFEIEGNNITSAIVDFDNDVNGWGDEKLGIATGHGLYVDFEFLHLIDSGLEMEIKMMQETIALAKEMNKLKVKKLRPEIKLPFYASEKASGFDVRAYDCVYWDIHKEKLMPVVMEKVDGVKGWLIPPHITVIFKTGLAVACGESEEVQARARSGYSLKSPMRLSNGIGTIDEDFRGEVGIIMDNNGQYGNWFVPYEERIAQLVICPIIRKEIVEVDELDETERGTGAYGSTGTK